MNYTKGNWEIQVLPHKYDFRKGVAYVIRDRRNCALAEVGHIDAIFDGEETEANARLIAQAPAMYEALKALLVGNILDNQNPNRTVQRTFPSSEAIVAAYKVLAKVEGKQGEKDA